MPVTKKWKQAEVQLRFFFYSTKCSRNINFACAFNFLPYSHFHFITSMEQQEVNPPGRDYERFEFFEHKELQSMSYIYKFTLTFIAIICVLWDFCWIWFYVMGITICCWICCLLPCCVENSKTVLKLQRGVILTMSRLPSIWGRHLSSWLVLLK